MDVPCPLVLGGLPKMSPVPTWPQSKGNPLGTDLSDLGAVSRTVVAEWSVLQDLGLTDWKLNGLWSTSVLQQVLLQVTAG